MHKNLIILFAVLTVISLQAIAQPDLSYYLPENVNYNPDIPTPKSIIGHEVGELHVSHDKLISYMYALDRASDRISLEVMGYTHEKRPLVLLTITSPENHRNIETIRAEHVQLTDPLRSSTLNTRNMPAVFYLGCSIHGNEPSGSNAGMLMAYHLAAAQGSEIEAQLRNTIILFDPSFNPDGFQRFANWANSRKSMMISADPSDMEHNEAWPGGRTNHYWFDLNRDWLVAQHPESQARIKKFHEWKPNLLTDHHEMGTNATFFFQPGVPSRMHPLTPSKNLELTKKLGEYHARALDAIGSLYYTQESFDDFYIGKGSTFPDVQGAVGILFEQASSRGHEQESANGIVRFPFTIRNQFTTMLSSLTGLQSIREELLNYQRQFFKDAQAEASKDAVKAFVFGSKDRARAFHLAEILKRQDIIIHQLTSDQTINNKPFKANESYVVSTNQKQYRLLKGMFEKRTKFTDSLFYDISAWTLSLAAGVDFEELKTLPSNIKMIDSLQFPQGTIFGEKSTYAFAFEPHGYYAPHAVQRLLHQGIRIKVANGVFNHPDGKRFERGSIIIPLADQEKSADIIAYLLKEIAMRDAIDIYGFETGLDYKGSSLGSGSFATIRKPEIAMLVDGNVSANDAGEIWHLLDTRMQIPMTLIPVHVFNRADLGRYNTIIIPPGTYPSITEHGREKLKSWIQNGGTVIGFENALLWLHANGMGRFDMKKTNEANDEGGSAQRKSYAQMETYRGAQQTSGAIFQVAADLTHPLLYGYENSILPVFKGNNYFLEPSKNEFANPLVFTDSPLLSGYISKQNYARLKQSSFAGVSVVGKGRVIGFTDNLCFRGFWFGTNKMLMNAIFYGHLIHEGSAR